MKRAFYQSIFITFLSVILTFGFKVYIAQLINKEELALFFTAIDIFTSTLMILVGFRSSMIVAFAKTKEDVHIINIFRGVVIVTVLLAWALVIPYLKHEIGVDIHYWYLVAMVLALGLDAYLQNQLAMYRLYHLINAITFLQPVGVIAWFIIAFFLANTTGVKPLFIAYIMSTLMISGFIIYMKKRYVKVVPFKKVDFDGKTKNFLKTSVMSTIEFGSGIFMMYMAVFLMMEFYSLNDLGDFQVVAKPIFMAMIMMFVFPIFRFVMPELSKLIAEKEWGKVRAIRYWVYRYAFIVGGCFLVFSLLFMQKIVLLLFPPQYAASYLMVVHIAFVFVFVLMNAYQISFIKASGAFLSALIIRLCGLATVVVVFLLLYKFYSESPMTIIMSLASSYVVMFLVSLYYERRIHRRLCSE